jgi:hypothetical protein
MKKSVRIVGFQFKICTQYHSNDCFSQGNDDYPYSRYEGESVIRKTCDIRTLKQHFFLDISFTNIDTLVPSLYQCIETSSIEVF